MNFTPVINEDVYVELLELLELYCELLIARFGLLDQKWVLKSPAHPLAPRTTPSSFLSGLLTYRDVRVDSVTSTVLGNLTRALAKASVQLYMPLHGQN